MSDKVMVVPCSGIGKVMGLLARETALQVTSRIAPDLTQTACLGHLVTGEADATAKVSGLPCLTVDGCTAYCAAVSVAAVGGIIREKYLILDEMRLHRGKNAGDASNLTADGWMMVDSLAEKIAINARSIAKEE